MIKFRCPSCAKQYSVKDEFAGTGTSCRSCDTSFRVPMKRGQLKCVHCGSDNVQRLKVIYEMGTSSLSGTVGGMSANGRQQSKAAYQAAPPQRKKGAGVVIVDAIALFLVGLIIAVYVKYGTSWLALSVVPSIGLLLLMGGLLWLKQQHEWNKQVFPKLRDQWLNSHRCFKCGEVFTCLFVEDEQKQ
jgi:hypothetical protein